MMTDRRGNTICEKTDRFYFDPPCYPGEEDPYDYLRGRVVRIGEVRTAGRVPTVTLRSTDPVMREFLTKSRRLKIGYVFPLTYLKLID